jgi:hypothetical protein
MTVTREKLFEEIWAEPMTTVAARYNVSSTYLARICKRLKVPLPGRGHWAQVAVGKGVRRPGLPKARVGDELEWSKGHEPGTQLPLQPPDTNGKERRRRFPRSASHHLVFGARAHLEAGVDSYSSYLTLLRVGHLAPAAATGKGRARGGRNRTRGIVRAVAARAARKPRCNDASDGEPSGDKGIGEMPFRPRATACRYELAVDTRGENAARVQQQ